MDSTTLNKVVLITGASSGIGEATARRLADAGHTVVLGARRLDRIEAVARQIIELGGRALAVALDVTHIESVRAFVAEAHARFGRIDVFVNNAGVMPLSLVSDLRVAEWDQMIDVNLRGVLHGIASVLPIMQQQHSGHIINIASTSAHRVDPTAAVYCATKFAVRAFSEGLRQESKELRVTVISPGLTRTGLFDGIQGAETREASLRMLEASSIPPSAIANAIAFAISQPAEVDVNEIIVRPTAQG